MSVSGSLIQVRLNRLLMSARISNRVDSLNGSRVRLINENDSPPCAKPRRFGSHRTPVPKRLATLLVSVTGTAPQAFGFRYGVPSPRFGSLGLLPVMCWSLCNRVSSINDPSLHAFLGGAL